jgi:hypothetical protein
MRENRPARLRDSPTDHSNSQRVRLSTRRERKSTIEMRLPERLRANPRLHPPKAHRIREVSPAPRMRDQSPQTGSGHRSGRATDPHHQLGPTSCLGRVPSVGAGRLSCGCSFDGRNRRALAASLRRQRRRNGRGRSTKCYRTSRSAGGRLRGRARWVRGCDRAIRLPFEQRRVGAIRRRPTATSPPRPADFQMRPPITDRSSGTCQLSVRREWPGAIGKPAAPAAMFIRLRQRTGTTLTATGFR